MIKHLLIALLLSLIGTVILFIGAAVSGGMCHCMTAMYTLFPYGAFTTMTFSSDTLSMAILNQSHARPLRGARFEIAVAAKRR